MKYLFFLILILLLNSCSNKDKEISLPIQENDAEILKKSIKF